MEKEQLMCYITYAVPSEMLPRLSFGEMPFPEKKESAKEEMPLLYPAGFVPSWFRAGSFPEDDWEE